MDSCRGFRTTASIEFFLSEVNVWVSGGSDTQNTQRYSCFILVQASNELYVQQYGVFVLGIK